MKTLKKTMEVWRNLEAAARASAAGHVTENAAAEARAAAFGLMTENAARADYGAAVNAAARFVALSVLKYCESKGEKAEVIQKLRAAVYEGGSDIESAAKVAILSEVSKAAERAAEAEARGEEAAAEFMETAYTYRRHKHRVLIGKASAEYVEAEAAPASLIHRAARKEIRDSAAVKVAAGDYCYFDDTEAAAALDGEKVYRRAAKYDGLIIDFDGGAATVNAAAIDDIESIIEKLQLSPKEAQILTYRRRGYGIKAAAAALGITVDNCKVSVKRIRAKAAKIGIMPAYLEAEAAAEYAEAEAAERAAERAARAAEVAARYGCNTEAAAARAAAEVAAERAAEARKDTAARAKAAKAAAAADTARAAAIKAAQSAAAEAEAARIAERVESKEAGAEARRAAAAVYAYCGYITAHKARRAAESGSAAAAKARAKAAEAEARAAYYKAAAESAKAGERKAAKARAKAAAAAAAEARAKAPKAAAESAEAKAARAKAKAAAEAERAAEAKQTAAALVSGWNDRRVSEVEARRHKAAERAAARAARAALTKPAAALPYFG